MTSSELIGTALGLPQQSETSLLVPLRRRKQERARASLRATSASSAPSALLTTSLGMPSAANVYVYEGHIGATAALAAGTAFRPRREFASSDTLLSFLEQSPFGNEGSLARARLAIDEHRAASLSRLLPIGDLIREGVAEFETTQVRTLVGLEVERLLVSSTDETFDDGTESSFSETLAILVRAFGNDALTAIEKVLEAPNVDPEVASQALRRLGDVPHEASRKYRLTIIARHLHSPSARLRYAAALGLAAVDDPAAIPSVASALGAERDPDVQRCLRRVLAQLEDTRRCLPTSELSR